MANRPAPETDVSAEFTYVDGYDALATPPLDVHTSQPKLFSLFRSKRTAEPTSIQPMETTITADSYSGRRGPQQSSVRRQDNAPYPGYQQINPPFQGYQHGVPQLLVTAPSRPDTADFTDADWARDMRPPPNHDRPSAWQTMNAVDHSQRGYGQLHGWASTHQQNVDFDAAQSQGYSAGQQSPLYAGWSNTLPREGSPRRSPRLGGGPQRSFDDHWATDGERTSDENNWERRKSLPSIVKLPVTPTAPLKQPDVGTTTSAVPLRRRQVDTYVIENGVRKRVRCVVMIGLVRSA